MAAATCELDVSGQRNTSVPIRSALGDAVNVQFRRDEVAILIDDRRVAARTVRDLRVALR